MTTPNRPARSYQTLDTDTQDAMKQARIAQLEREHYDNVLALQEAQAKAASTPEEDEANTAEAARLESNLDIIESALDALETS